MGTMLVESSNEEDSTLKNEELPSQCMYSLPFGSEFMIQSLSADVMRSGRRQRSTSSFWNGVLSSFFQSSGSFTSSGASSFTHSLKRFGASFSMFCAKDSKPSSSISFCTANHAPFGSHSAIGF